MYKLGDKLNLLLKQMTAGAEVRLKSGHTLVIPEGHEEPGFKATSSKGGEVVIQIGSETAWMFLIDHARDMTREGCIAFILQNANINELRRRG